MAPEMIRAEDTAELLDALDLRMQQLRCRVAALMTELQAAKRVDVHFSIPAVAAASIAPDRLRVQMNYAGLTKASFATVFGVPVDTVQGWLEGQEPIPAWVISSVHIFELLSTTQKTRFLRASAVRSTKNPAKVHPFSRIEEL
jgi:hypothetical protein